MFNLGRLAVLCALVFLSTMNFSLTAGECCGQASSFFRHGNPVIYGWEEMPLHVKLLILVCLAHDVTLKPSGHTASAEPVSGEDRPIPA